jgi:hypothetical protein
MRFLDFSCRYALGEYNMLNRVGFAERLSCSIMYEDCL